MTRTPPPADRREHSLGPDWPTSTTWIDRQNGVGGFWATQIFPFADPTSVVGYLDFETAIYNNL